MGLFITSTILKSNLIKSMSDELKSDNGFEDDSHLLVSD